MTKKKILIVLLYNIIVVWIRPDGSYYSKFIKGHYERCKYEIGYVNQYGHKICLVMSNPYTYYGRVNYPRTYLKKFVGWLYKRI